MTSSKSASSRERVILENLASALRMQLDASDRELTQADLGDLVGTSESSFPGIFHVKAPFEVITGGSTAFLTLADYYKKAVFVSGVAGGILGQKAAPKTNEEQADRVVWSALNTSKVFAFGHQAWRSVQLLPIRERRRIFCPPLKLATPAAADSRQSRGVLLISHTDTFEHLEAIAAEVSSRPEISLQAYGARLDGIHCLLDELNSSGAVVHVHIGKTGLRSDQLRVVDSWRSGVPVVNYVPSEESFRHEEGDPNIEVSDGWNGLSAVTPAATVRAIEHLLSDQVLRGVLIEGGHLTVAEAVAGWDLLAKELLE